MPTNLQLDMATLAGFLLILTRLGGILVFVPIPGARGAAEPARVLLVLSLSVALFPFGPRPDVQALGGGQFLCWMAGEALMGIAVGMLVGFLSESLVFGAQAIVVQAGFSYASAVDPNSQADSTVLQIIAQLAANLLFFATGMDHVVLKAFVRSLETCPPGSRGPGWNEAGALVGMGGAMLELGIRLALPVAGLLLLTDVTLALVGRIQTQLQLLSLAFPAKMLGTLAALAALAPMMAWVYRSASTRFESALFQLIR